MKLLIAALGLVAVAQAAVIPNYFGVGDWTDDSLWQNGQRPTATSEAWMNTDLTTCTIRGAPAEVNKLVIARKSQDTVLQVENDLTIGSLLFMGQYIDGDGVPSHGTLNLVRGHVHVQSGEMSVGVSAEGTYHQMGGTTIVDGQCKIGRYNQAEAVGDVQLDAGSLACSTLKINPYSAITLNGGVLRLNGKKAVDVQRWVDSKHITWPSASQTAVRIEENDDRTLVYTVDPDARRVISNFVDGTGQQDWFDPNNYPQMQVPTVNDELWMNMADTKAVVSNKQVAMMRVLVVGRHAINVELEIATGGELLVGDATSSGILFLGQYGDGEGKLTLQPGSTTNVYGELAVGVAGPGQLDLLGAATVNVDGRLILGRYNVAKATGEMTMMDGTVTAKNFEINTYSTLQMEGGSIVIEKKNLKSRIDGYVADGRIASTGTISVVYDSAADTTTLTVTHEPSASPSMAPTATAWDIAGIMSFTQDDVGPIMPQVIRDAGLREFTEVPPAGVHPRILFGPDEIPAIRNRLSDTSSPMAVEAMKQVEVYTLSMRRGRQDYDTLPNDVKKLPSGTQRISNPGLFDTSISFTELVAGVTTNLASQSDTHRNTLAGVMAVEAFYCVVFEGVNADVDQRASDLAAAMDSWAQWVVAEPTFSYETRDLGGGQHMAFAYDLLFNFMSTDQQANIRAAIAKMIWPESEFKAHLITPYAVQSNWVTLNSFVSVMVMAIEGDVVDEVADYNWSNARLSDYQHQIMIANYNFLTYGWYSTGDPYEGMGKNYQYNMMMVAYAKRGYNFFTHPHVQAYAFNYLVAQMQPFGHYITIYDALGGGGFDPVVGGHRHKAVDIIALKHAFPTHPAVNFAYRNFIETPYSNSNGDFIELAIDADKVSARSTYENSFLGFLVMGSDFDGTDDFQTQNEDSRDSLSFAGMERGLIIANSDYSEDALEMQFHVRQDMGGHTMADRNNVLLSGLGRIWTRLPKGYIYDTEWTNGILVNDVGVPVTKLDGTKARQPAKLAHYQDEQLATFATGDATYAYNTRWYWTPRHADEDYTRTGYTPVTETYNDFRRSDNKISHDYGNISFYDYPHWWRGGYLERNIKETANDMKQVYRLAGLVRGTYPYTLIVDDLEKASGGDSTNYKWIAQIPEDLTLLPVTDYPAGLDSSRDVVLTEPAETGNRRLLVRILNADGSQPGGLFEFNESITYYQWGKDRIAKRFIIERVARLPRFRVLLFPFSDGDTLPQHSVDTDGNIVVDWPNVQRDVLVFGSDTQSVDGDTVEITSLKVVRSGVTLIDTSNQVEPNSIRS